MAEYEGDDGDGDEDELPSVDHGPLNEGPWEKDSGTFHLDKIGGRRGI